MQLDDLTKRNYWFFFPNLRKEFDYVKSRSQSTNSQRLNTGVYERYSILWQH